MIPTYQVLIDWSGDGTYTGVGEDVSARVLDRGTSLSMRYGRDQARAFAPVAGGRAQFELNNASRDYSPENTSSPLAGNVLAGRPVRIRATLSGTTYAMLQGSLDDYDVLPGLEQQSIQVTCLDELARLASVRVTTDLYAGLRTGAAISVLLDAAGWDPDLRDLDPGASTLPWWWVDGDDALGALQQLLDSEGPGSLAAVDGDGRFLFRDRHHRLTRSASTTAQATFRASGVEPCMSDLTYDHGWKEIVNSVAYAIPVRSPSGQLTTVWSTDAVTVIADGQMVLVPVSASEPFIQAVTPEVGVDFQLTSGTVTVTLSRTSGRTVTVFLRASGGPAVVTGLQLRAYSVATVRTAQVSAEEPTSIDRYGRRSWPSGRDPVWASVADAEAIAEVILAHRAERLPAVTITLKGGVRERLVQQLSRDLSDRVHIVDPETGLDADFWIEQIQHTVAGLNHVTQFGCEKVPQLQTDLMILDVGQLDVNRLGSIGVDSTDLVFILDSPGNGLLNINLLGH
jgi:hypothetical protein